MAERQPDNIIFQFKTTVADKDDPAKLAAGIEVADASMKDANRTVETFDKGVSKSIATWKAARAEQERTAKTTAGTAATMKDATTQVGRMGDTVTKAGKALGALRGIGKEEAGFLRPFITRADELGKHAVSVGGDLEFLKRQAKELAQIPVSVLAPQKVTANRQTPVPAPVQPQPGPVTKSAPDPQALRANTEEVHRFAEALLNLSRTGAITYDELRAAALEELATVREVNAELAKTPQGQEALKVDIDQAQKEALDLLVTLKAITAEDRAQLEMATKFANAANRAPIPTPATAPRPTTPQPVAPAAPAALPSAPTGSVLADTIALGDAAQAAKVDFQQLAAELVALGPDAQASFDKLGVEIQEDTRLLEALVTIASEQPGGAEALAKDLDAVQSNTLKSMRAMGALTKEEAKAVEQALKLTGATGKQEPTVKKVAAGWTSLRKQVQQAKAELDALIEASDGKITPELIAAAKRAGELQDRFEDLQATVSAFNPDKKFQVLTAVVTNAAGAFTAAQGALALFGTENQAVEKGLLRVQAALAFTQGLQALFGGLRDNMKNLRLLLLSNAAAARVLAAAEGQAAAGAATQAASTSVLSGALTTCRAAAVGLWATLVANPIGIIVAAFAVLIATVIALASAEEEAKLNADDLLASLDRVSKARLNAIANNKTAESLSKEKQAVAEILELEKERAAIPRSYTDDQKALANFRIDQKIAAVEARQQAQQAALDIKALAQERTTITDDQIEVEAALQDMYKRGGQVYVESEDKKAAAAAERLGALMNVSDQEANAAIRRAAVMDKLTDEEIDDLKKLEEKRDALIEAEEKNNEQRKVLREKERIEALKHQTDLVKAAKDEAALVAKVSADGILKGSIEALQKEQQKLLDTITKKAVIGSPVFFDAVKKYQQVTEQLKAAQDLLKEQDAFPVGSLDDLNQELAFLKDQLNRLPEGAEDFDKVRAAVILLEKEIEELQAKLKPVDTKAITAAKLAELEELRRHHFAVSDLDQQAALTRARNEHKSEQEVKDIEDEFKAQRLRDEIDFERKRLAILQAAGKDKEEEVKSSLNRIRELELELGLPEDTTDDDKAIREKVEKITGAAQQIAQAGIDAWQAWSDAQARALDRQIELQRDRVAAAQGIADKGNAEILQKEKDRLQALTDARRKAAERNAAIAQIEAAANAVVAITRAAAEGGGWLSAVTIAATLIALTSGIIQARTLAQDSVPVQGFYKGTKYVDHEGRYPSGVDTVPANLTRGERVVDAATSAHHRTLYDGLQDNDRNAVRRGIMQTAAKYGLGIVVGQAIAQRPHPAAPVGVRITAPVTGREGVRVERTIFRTERTLVKAILPGRLNMRDTMPQAVKVTVKADPGLSEKQVDRIVRAVEGQPRTSVRFDADGLTVEMVERAARARALRSRL